MQARRTFAHGPDGGWSAVAVSLAPAEDGKNGFYLTLFPDGRGPTVLFLSGAQVLNLIDMSASSSVTDAAVWAVVAKIPMEPMLPSRYLPPRLRTLLVDFASPIREMVRGQAERAAAAAAASQVDIDEVEAEEFADHAANGQPAEPPAPAAEGGAPAPVDSSDDDRLV